MNKQTSPSWYEHCIDDSNNKSVVGMNIVVTIQIIKVYFETLNPVDKAI